VVEYNGQISAGSVVGRNTRGRCVRISRQWRYFLTLCDLGKTYLSSTVIGMTSKMGHTLFAFLSYNNSFETSALSIIHSLIFQLASNDEALQAILCQSDCEKLSSSIDHAIKTLKQGLQCAGPVYVIVDGLDEIHEFERYRLIENLLNVSATCEEIRILFSSRAEADITTLLKNKCMSIRVDTHNAESIQAFVEQQTRKWFKERDFAPDAQTDIESLLVPLSSKAKGMKQ